MFLKERLLDPGACVDSGSYHKSKGGGTEENKKSARRRRAAEKGEEDEQDEEEAGEKSRSGASITNPQDPRGFWDQGVFRSRRWESGQVL